MDPVTIAQLGLGLAGAVSGASAQSKALKEQRAQNDQQNDLTQRQLDLAELAQQQSLATTIDTNGNISYYDPKTNVWRTILSPEQQRTMNASNAELYRQLTSDAALARGQAVANAARQQGEGQTADTILRQVDAQLAGRGTRSGSSLTSALRRARQGAVTSAFDDTSAALNRQALRSGSAAAGTFGKSLAKARAQTIAQTMGVPEIEGMQLADDMNMSKLNNMTGLYSTYASRAAGTPNTVNPNTNIGSALTAALSGTRSNAQNATSNLSSAFGTAANRVGTQPIVTDNTTSSLISGIGTLLNSSGALKSASDYLSGLNKKRTTGGASGWEEWMGA